MSALIEFSETLPVTTLKGVGPRQAERLARLSIYTLADLLFHLPMRYQDRTRVAPIGSLRPGAEVVIQAEVVMGEIVQRGRRALLCRVRDGTGSLTLRFFHFSAAQYHFLSHPGTRLRCFGEVRVGPATLEMIHPECRRWEEDAPNGGENCLTPVYPTTEGLSQHTLRTLTEQVLTQLSEYPESLPELIPAELRRHMNLPSLVDALRLIHRPPADNLRTELALAQTVQPAARQRLAFEELLAHQLSLVKLRRQTQRHQAPPLAAKGKLVTAFLKQLPFALTAAQQRVSQEILDDLTRTRPMLRLVQGDVGSGKTVVAAIAALRAVEAGWQAAVMAPTELLAEQHYRNFSTWLQPLELTTAWLSGRLKGKAREAMLAQIRTGDAAVVVGTHALFQEGVNFAKLALIVIDEQHRFGVHQRLALREKGQQASHRPHQLIMTATPIPRTLAMSVYADLDTSVIDELPPGRYPIQTVVVPESRRVEVIERIRLACQQGRQAYWVCTLIDESETLDYQAAADTAEQLTAALPELRIGLVHGRLKSAEKESMMAAFKAAELDLLVATTVIEVGVDVPNASLMVIENAERLGLAQLHQLRGRIGRSDIASSCVLLYRGPLSNQARSRLAVLRESNDGFEIARHDLELRGPGEVLGTRQTGALQMRIADWIEDEPLLSQVRHTAARLLTDHPQCSEAIIRRWIGQGERYGEV